VLAYTLVCSCAESAEEITTHGEFIDCVAGIPVCARVIFILKDCLFANGHVIEEVPDKTFVPTIRSDPGWAFEFPRKKETVASRRVIHSPDHRTPPS